MLDTDLIAHLSRFCSTCSNAGSLENYFLEQWEGMFQLILDDKEKLWIKVENNRVDYGLGSVSKYQAKFEMPTEIAKTIFSGLSFALASDIRKNIKLEGSNANVMKFFQLSDLVWFNREKINTV